MNKTLLPAIKLLDAFQSGQINCTQISVWKASLIAIKNKYSKKFRKKKPKPHQNENLEQCQELISFLDKVEKALD